MTRRFNTKAAHGMLVFEATMEALEDGGGMVAPGREKSLSKLYDKALQDLKNSGLSFQLCHEWIAYHHHMAVAEYHLNSMSGDDMVQARLVLIGVMYKPFNPRTK